MPQGTQQDDNTFYIVDEELMLLSSDAQKAWKGRLQKETLTAYETPQQIDARMKAVSYKKYPELQSQIDAYVSQLKSGKLPKEVSFKNFPEEAIDTFLFSIGASGISAMIDMYLREKSVQENAEMMEGIAALSRARHKILEKNAAVFA